MTTISLTQEEMSDILKEALVTKFDLYDHEIRETGFIRYYKSTTHCDVKPDELIFELTLNP